MTTATGHEWLLILPKIPSEPSRHRVAVWRELRRAGAVPAASGAWTMPDVPAFTDRLAAIRELTERGAGSLSVFRAGGYGADDTEGLREAFAAARRDEWVEFVADCGKFDAEIEREIAKEKFTFGELEEEEQSLDRLRRWHRDLQKRDALALPEAVEATGHLERCTEHLARYAELVFAANLPPEPSA